MDKSYAIERGKKIILLKTRNKNNNDIYTTL